jgi:hypothetical protein
MKIFHTLILLTIANLSFSQIQKNQWMIGGNAAFSIAQASELKTTSIQLAPNVGYFFINKMAGGLRFGFGSDTYSSGGDKYRWTNLAISPFLRYYFLPATQQVNLFAEGAYSYAWSKYKDVTNSGSYAYRYNGFSLMGGPAIFLNEHTALEITLGYSHSTRGPVDSTTTNRFQLGVGLQIHLGKAKQ